jgi:hypothetical protein
LNLVTEELHSERVIEARWETVNDRSTDGMLKRLFDKVGRQIPQLMELPRKFFSVERISHTKRETSGSKHAEIG